MLASIVRLLIIVLLASCARLDSNLFNPSKVDQYLLDGYTGYVDLTLDSSFAIPENMITQFELDSYLGSESVKIKAIFVGDEARFTDPTYKIILYCHGNRDHLDFYWPRVKLLANAGGKNHFGVLAFDYRGYGASGGTPSEEGLYADTNTMIEWLKSKGVTSSQFILYGFSMGTAPATELSAKPRSTLVPSRLILEAPFASAEVMVQDASLLALPSSYFTNLKIDNAEEIKSVTQPLLWIHGVQDDFLSIKTHGEVVYKNHPGVEGQTKYAVRVNGAGHSDIPLKYGSQAFYDYMNLVHAFVNGERINL